VRAKGPRSTVASTARRAFRAHRILSNRRGPDKFANLSHEPAAPPRGGERLSVSWLVEPSDPGLTSPITHNARRARSLSENLITARGYCAAATPGYGPSKENNTEEQFRASPDLNAVVDNAVIDSMDAQQSLSVQVLNSPEIRAGLIRILLNQLGLYEKLKTRATGV